MTKDNLTERPCTTHHHACDCRESKFAQQQALLEECAEKFDRVKKAWNSEHGPTSFTVNCPEADALLTRLRGDHGSRENQLYAIYRPRYEEAMTMGDPLEKKFAEACKAKGIKVHPHDHYSGLDFYLPDFDVYVELKQFHSDRIAEQMSRRKNVIAIQGMEALDTFIELLGDHHG